MKLYNGLGPNPQVVRIFMAEKGMDIPLEQVDIMAAENRKEPHLSRNPAGGLPTLELDDGSFLSEITAICEYLEEKQPEPALIGTTPEERAECRMWTRRIDLQIVENMTSAFRYSEGLPLFKERVSTIPEAADGLKALVRERMAWLDGQIEGKQYVCGDRLTLADILLYAFVTFGGSVGQPLPDECGNIKALVERVGARPSAKA